jgi:hypothetical protein
MPATVHPLTALAVAAAQSATDPHSVRGLPGLTPRLLIESDEDWAAVARAVRAALGETKLAITPVTLSTGLDYTIIGPSGVLNLEDIVPINGTLDTWVYPAEPDSPARVVISWVDGLTVERAAAILAAQQQSGLSVELIREQISQLTEDVITAPISRADETATEIGASDGTSLEPDPARTGVDPGGAHEPVPTGAELSTADDRRFAVGADDVVPPDPSDG